MTRSDFENSFEYTDMLYIGDNWQTTKRFYSEENKEIICDVSGPEGTKSYELNTYLRLYGIYVSLKATDEPIEIKQMEILVEGRSAMVHVIENVKRKSEGKELKIKYKYEGHLREIDSHIQMAKAQLENKLLESQVKTNNNTIRTNRTNKTLLRLTTAFALIATIVGGISALIAWADYKRELNKEGRERQIRQSDSVQLASSFENVRLKNSVDSLSRIVDYYQKKPLDSGSHH